MKIILTKEDVTQVILDRYKGAGRGGVLVPVVKYSSYDDDAYAEVIFTDPTQNEVAKTEEKPIDLSEIPF